MTTGVSYTNKGYAVHTLDKAHFIKDLERLVKKQDTSNTEETKVVPTHAVKTYKGSEGIAPFIRKAVPLRARSGPEGSRKLRFPDFMTLA